MLVLVASASKAQCRRRHGATGSSGAGCVVHAAGAGRRFGRIVDRGIVGWHGAPATEMRRQGPGSGGDGEPGPAVTEPGPAHGDTRRGRRYPLRNGIELRGRVMFENWIWTVALIVALVWIVMELGFLNRLLY